MKTIRRTFYGGIDWRDKTTKRDCLMEDNSFDIKHEADVIATDIVNILMESTTGKLTPGTFELIKQYIEEGDTLCFFDTEESSATFYVEKDRMELHLSALGGQVNYHYWYDFCAIEEKNVRYLVVENFLNPYKGIPSIAWFYHEPYQTQQEAEIALESLKLHDPLKSGSQSRKELWVVDIEAMQSTLWYEKNMEFIRKADSGEFSFYGDEFNLFDLR